ncbi:toxin RelE [Xenorhabdus sp. TS4]|nr:toxin RelE [Xenorhabdus sp. TS4]
MDYMKCVVWTVILTDCFYFWLAEQDGDTQEKVLASLGNLERYGPRLSRPYADTIKGSKYPNMKELRVQHTGKPIRARSVHFLLLIQKDKLLFYVLEIKVMIKNSIKK